MKHEIYEYNMSILLQDYEDILEEDKEGLLTREMNYLIKNGRDGNVNSKKSNVLIFYIINFDGLSIDVRLGLIFYKKKAKKPYANLVLMRSLVRTIDFVVRPSDQWNVRRR